MDPHPITGQLFDSPAPPGAGWPGDPATPDTPVATTPAKVRRLAKSADGIRDLDARISVCRACPRLVAWREDVARDGRRASFADEPYWGRPGPGFGDPEAEVLIVGLAPAANGANRTGRMFTGDASGDFLFAALHRTGFANQPESTGAGDGLELTGMRIVASVRCAPPKNLPTPEEKANCAPWLARDLTIAEPRLRSILTLGGIGFAATLEALRDLGWVVPEGKWKFKHGLRVPVTSPSGRHIEVVASYHVSPHNTFTKRLTPEMLDEVLLSLRHGPDTPGSSTIRLVEPDLRFQESYLAALDEYRGEHRDGDGELILPADGDFAGCSFTRESLADPAVFAALVEHRIADELPETPRPEGWVPCTFRWIEDPARPGTYLGSIALRHELTDFLREFGGHIGYSVRPTERGQGIATAALGEMLAVARERGMERVLVTCQDTNVGSARVIEANGGVLEDVRVDPDGHPVRRYWVPASAATP